MNTSADAPAAPDRPPFLVRDKDTLRTMPEGHPEPIRGRRGLATLASAALLAAAVVTMAPALAVGSRLWTFNEDPAGEPPRGWEVQSGTWEVRLDEDGQNRVLVQAGPPLPGFDLLVILAPVAPVRDLRATVRMKPAGTRAFETMGLILRWQDPGTMTILRVDGSPGRIWLERVRGGQSILRAGYVVPLWRDRWNVLRVTAQRSWLNLFFNGKFLGGVREDKPVPGRVGLLAGPDAGVLLDDFEIQPLRGTVVTR